MDPQFRNIVQEALTSYGAVNTRTDGGYAGSTVPHTPDEFAAILKDEAKSFKFNNWSLDTAEADELIRVAKILYINNYAQWVNLPLSGDAPADVVAWQENARNGQ